MTFHLWLTYFGIIAVLIAIPGPSALVNVSHGLMYGRKNALSTVLGGVLAAIILMSVSALGLGAILAASKPFFLAVKFLGASYLVWLGILSLRSRTDKKVEKSTIRPSCPPTFLFRKGFIVGISNPKDIIFFAALFPNFIDTGSPYLPQFLLLAATWCFLDFSLMFAYACAGKKMSFYLSNYKWMRRFNRVSGGLFIVAGGALAISNK